MPDGTPTPTQEQYPRRAAIRTAVQVGLAVLLAIPVAVSDLGIPLEGLLAQVVAVAVAVARLMAVPAVARLIRDHAPWLAPAPPAQTPPGQHEAPGEAPGAASGTVGAGDQ